MSQSDTQPQEADGEKTSGTRWWWPFGRWVGQRNEWDVEHTLAWTGVLVVLVGDCAIAGAAIWGAVKIGASDADISIIVSLLSGAFTAITAITTAYFGIRAATTTAQKAMRHNHGQPGPN